MFDVKTTDDLCPIFRMNPPMFTQICPALLICLFLFINSSRILKLITELYRRRLSDTVFPFYGNELEIVFRNDSVSSLVLS